jgi:hypothetical protein
MVILPAIASIETADDVAIERSFIFPFNSRMKRTSSELHSPHQRNGATPHFESGIPGQ